MPQSSNKIYIFLLFLILYCFELFGAASYEDRIRAEKAIESVYWKHRLWPKENKNPKPQFEKAVSADLIQSKVDDALRKSAALESIWKRPLLASELQAELDRIAKETKDPRMLRELFDALGNDPERIAESLARPILADRLIRGWYSYDQRFHGELRSKVERELVGVNSFNLRSLSGNYQEMIWKRSDQKSNDTSAISSSEWNDVVQKLSDVFQTPLRKAQLPVNEVSKIQENESEFYIMIILEKSDDAIKIGSMRWMKTSFEQWWSISKFKFQPEANHESFQYKLPKLDSSDGTCGGDQWSRTPSAPISDRSNHSAVWTGTEMIVWGGASFFSKNGGKYNPATDSWAPTTLIDAPAGRDRHTAIWTGSEMIVWGGRGCTDEVFCTITALNSGGRYDPVSDTWSLMDSANSPPASTNASAIWTGSQMIIWGGSSYSNTPWRYNPAQNLWSTGTTVNAPDGNVFHVAVWTGSEMIIWGGTGNPVPGKRYNPVADKWTTMSTNNSPPFVPAASAVWTQTEMIVWGGNGIEGDSINTGGRYNPISDTWVQTSTSNVPTARQFHTAVWTGTEMIIWGGFFDNYPNSTYLGDGGRYNPSTDSWTPLTLVNAPTKRIFHSSIWTGNEMIIFGGDGGGNSGGRYDPATDSWIPTGTSGVPRGRFLHTAVWTGNEMIIWGGWDYTFELNSGGVYNPSTNSWAIINEVSSLEPRRNHSAVWTGSEMIIWGGRNEGATLNSGARFDPLTWQWTPISNLNVPEIRYLHSTVWTGSEMIIWGGSICLNPPDCYDQDELQTGGRYDPIADQWSPTSMVNAPDKRADHSAIWTGTEMIIWGGENFGNNLLNDGSRYDPISDSWNDITVTNAPEPRTDPTAVWTGNKLIIWSGGNNSSDGINTGGVYDLASDTWTSTTMMNAPMQRYGQAGIWTGERLVVWGGENCVDVCGPLDTGGEYNVANDSWSPTSNFNTPPRASFHSAVWTGSYMIVWGGLSHSSEGGLYCVDPNNNYLFYDDFDDGILDPNWTYKRTWDENFRVLLGDGTAKKAIAIASPVFAGCSTCTADFAIQSRGGPLSKVWIYGWYADKKNSIELMMREDRDLWILKDRFNGTIVSKVKVSQQILPNVTYNVRMSYDGNQIQLFVDDFQNPIITFVPSHPIASGTIGLKVVNTDVWLQSISVY